MEPILACHHTLAEKRRKSSVIFGTGSGKDFKGGVRGCSLAMPNYAMSIYLLPKELCRELEVMINSFWWHSNHNGRKWITWVR